MSQQYSQQAADACRPQWVQVRRCFESVCDLPPEQWPQALQACGSDPAVVAEAWALLQASGPLEGAVPHLDSLLAQVPVDGSAIGPGQQLGPWQITAHLAEGGMGQVFAGQRADGLYQQQVAIKLIHARAAPLAAARLAAERQILAALQLPGVARLYDGGTTAQGQPYLVMEYVQGISLEQWSADLGNGLGARLRMFLAVCRIVQSAHAQLVLHCDLKPGNVHVRQDGSPVLLDFGVARLLSDTAVSADFCTPGYASPEQWAGQAVGVRSDVYSLGVMLVELLAARSGAGRLRVMPRASQWCERTLPWQGRLRGDLDAIASRACALDPGARYLTVGDLIADLEAHLERRPVKARQGALAYVWLRALHRNWRGWLLLTAVAAAAIWLMSALHAARQQALEQAVVAGQVSRFLVDTFELADPAKRSARGAAQMSARQLLDHAAHRAQQDLAGAPLELARMRTVLGEAYHNIGEPRLAQVLLAQAAEGLLEPPLVRRIDAAQVMSLLSEEQTAAGNGAQGLDTARKGLALLPARGHALVRARLYSASGLARNNLQQFSQAEEQLHQALALVGEVDPAQAAALGLEVGDRLSMVYWRWGRLVQAEAQLRAVIGQVNSNDRARLLELSIRLGRVLREQGRTEEAWPLLQNGLGQAEQLYGSRSRHVLELHDALADLHVDGGRWDLALAHFQQRLQLGEQVEGPDSLGIAMAQHNLGLLEQQRGNQQRAGELLQQSWQLRVAVLGADVPMSWRAAVGLARWQLSQGRIEQAGSLIGPAAAGLSTALPADAPGRIEAQIVLAQWELAAGQHEQAAQRYRQLEARASMPVPLRLAVLELCQSLRQSRSDGLAAATRCAQRALELARQHYGTQAPATAFARLRLAGLLARAGKQAEAQQLASQAGAVLEPLQVDGSPVLQTLRQLQQTR